MQRLPTGPSGALQLPMTRRDIANYLRLATETVSRVMTRFNERGLAAYILTLHPGALSFALLVAALLAAALFFALGKRPRAARLGLSLLLFVGATILGHVVLSHFAGVDALSVEVVRAR